MFKQTMREWKLDYLLNKTQQNYHINKIYLKYCSKYPMFYQTKVL